MKLSIETCISALTRALLNRRTAFQLELAVGLAVFLTQGGAGRDGRVMLCEVYAAAGYQCTSVTGIDYKTINRRINATATLYERLAVAKWAGKHVEGDLIQAICIGVAAYEFYGVADVQRFCQVDPTPPVQGEPLRVTPNPAILTGQSKVIEQFRRAADKPGRHVETSHLTVTIPDGTPRNELIELARKLLELADAKELLTA